MNRRELLKAFAAAGIAISVPASALKAGSSTVVAETAGLVKASDAIFLDLNKMPLISLETVTDNNIRHVHSLGGFESVPQLGFCERTVKATVYVDENIRRLFNELDQHRVHVFYRQPEHPNAEVTTNDPILIDSKAVLETMEMSVSGADWDVEAVLNLRLVA